MTRAIKSSESQIIPPDWTTNLTIYEVNLRQYTPGGTFREFREHLPRLKELGAGILWFMPFQPVGILNRKGTLGSNYSIRNYCEIDPAFGTFEEFKDLVKEIHQSGVYVILDWVANHTAWDHHWTEEHPEYFHRDDRGNFTPPNPDWSDVIGLDYGNHDLWPAMAGAMKFWLQEAGVDGFRCDMANLVPADFWVWLRPELESVKRVFMLAEAEQKELLGNGFDAIYNWAVFHAMNEFAGGRQKFESFARILERETTGFPPEFYQMFFTSNHDENSWNGAAVERLGAMLEPLAVLTFLLPGIPLVYSGQEAGESRRLSFFEKDLIDWKPDKMARLYQHLTRLRKQNPSLWSGEKAGHLDWVDTGTTDVLGITRNQDDSRVLALLNLSEHPRYLQINTAFAQGRYTSLFTGRQIYVYGSTRFILNSWESLVLEKTC